MNTTEKLSNIFYTVLGRRTHNRFQNLDVVQTIFRWEGNRPFVEDGFRESINHVFVLVGWLEQFFTPVSVRIDYDN